MSIMTDKQTGRLYCQFRFQGQTYKKRFPDGTTKAEAVKFETKWKHDLFFEVPQERGSMLWEPFIENVYLEYVAANQSEDSLKRAIQICKAATKYVGGKLLNDIRPADLERFKSDRMTTKTMHGKQRKPSTVHREMAIISKAFSMAMKNDLCLSNPMSKVDMPFFDNLQDRILHLEDEEAFLAAFNDQTGHDVALTALYTGLRQSDVLGLTGSEIDTRSHEIVLIQGKTLRRVAIPILPRLRAMLYSRAGNGLLFPSPSGKQMKSTRTGIVNACRRAGIGRLTIRDLRRTFGTRLHENGFDDMTIAMLLGHAGLRMIPRYKRGTEIKKKAILSLENLVDSTKIATRDLNGVEAGYIKPSKLLVEMRRVELLTSAMPLRDTTREIH